MDTRSCWERGADVLVLPCADLGAGGTRSRSRYGTGHSADAGPDGWSPSGRLLLNDTPPDDMAVVERALVAMMVSGAAFGRPLFVCGDSQPDHVLESATALPTPWADGRPLLGAMEALPEVAQDLAATAAARQPETHQ